MFWISNLRKTEILLTVCKVIPNLIAALNHSTAFYFNSMKYGTPGFLCNFCESIWEVRTLLSVIGQYFYQFPPPIWAWKGREKEAKMYTIQLVYCKVLKLMQLSRERPSKLNLAGMLLRSDFSIRQQVNFFEQISSKLINYKYFLQCDASVPDSGQSCHASCGCEVNRYYTKCVPYLVVLGIREILLQQEWYSTSSIYKYCMSARLM